MTDNMRHWDRFADIDPAFTKPITGKAYKGTSPNPQYIIRCLTEMFGPVGVGFGWTVEREDFTALGEETLHWCRIKFWHGDRANSFDSYGQTKALMKTRNGMMLDEDAPKKSLTDAIIKAASHVGIAANIFLGRWDDQKYVAQVSKEFADPPANGGTEAGNALQQAREDVVVDRLPENATPAQKAEGFAAAIIAEFKTKGIKALPGAWDRWANHIERFREAYPDLYARVVDAYELRKMELEEAA